TECNKRGFIERLPSGRPDWKLYGYYPGVPPWRFEHFSPEDMIAIQKRFLRRFYFNPRFIWRALSRVRSLHHLSALVSSGRDVTWFISQHVSGRSSGSGKGVAR
ncbi:MAG: hypothetical protein ACI9EF_002899, partial [Pseudohongiellaceae bacterium]